MPECRSPDSPGSGCFNSGLCLAEWQTGMSSPAQARTQTQKNMYSKLSVQSPPLRLSAGAYNRPYQRGPSPAPSASEYNCYIGMRSISMSDRFTQNCRYASAP